MTTERRPAQVVIPAEPGWSLVTLVRGSDPPRLADMPIIAWVIEAVIESDHAGSGCTSAAWPITAELDRHRGDNGHPGYWCLRQPSGRYTCQADLCDGDAAACLRVLQDWERAS